jgi:hypothetical protein
MKDVYVQTALEGNEIMEFFDVMRSPISFSFQAEGDALPQDGDWNRELKTPYMAAQMLQTIFYISRNYISLFENPLIFGY